MTTLAMSTVPTKALERLLNLPPLHTAIEAAAIMGAYRLGQPNLRAHETGHGRIWEMARTIDKCFGMPKDRIAMEHFFDKPYRALIPTREAWEKRWPSILGKEENVWFADASKYDQSVGIGITNAKGADNCSVALGEGVTILQAEIMAITVAIERSQQKGLVNKQIYICTDSQSAIKVLSSHQATSLVVAECVNKLYTLAQENRVTVLWTPGHCSIKGNMIAGKLAKEGTKKELATPRPCLPVAYSVIKSKVKAWISKQTEMHWRLASGMNVSKTLIGDTPSKYAKFRLGLDRKHARLMVTGHGATKHMWYKIGVVRSGSCRYCGEEEETSIHIICQCPAIARTRRETNIQHPVKSEG
jgi:ribonuclease HI